MHDNVFSGMCCLVTVDFFRVYCGVLHHLGVELCGSLQTLDRDIRVQRHEYTSYAILVKNVWAQTFTEALASYMSLPVSLQ